MSFQWGKDPVNDAIAILAKLYYFMGKEMIDRFGQEGETALRQAVRNFGRSRGKTLRARHEAMELPINVESLFTHYDLPASKDHDEVRNKIQLDKDNRVSETLICHLQQIWDELGGEEGNRIGAIYCDEFHPYMWAAYQSSIQTELPKLLTKGDPCCRFEVHRREKE